MVSAGMEQHARYECFHFNRPTSSRAAARTWTTVALRCTIEPPPYALGLFIRLCLFFRRARGVTTASVLQVLWALTVKSRGIGVTADRARTAASATQCWTALCVNARRSLPDSCVRWVSCSSSHTRFYYCGYGGGFISRWWLFIFIARCISCLRRSYVSRIPISGLRSLGSNPPEERFTLDWFAAYISGFHQCFCRRNKMWSTACQQRRIWRENGVTWTLSGNITPRSSDAVWAARRRRWRVPVDGNCHKGSSCS